MSLNSAPLWGRAVIERFSLFFVPSSTDIVESSVCMTSHPTPLFRTMFCPSVGPTTWSRQATTTILAWPCHMTHLPNPPPADDPGKGKCLAVEWVYLEAFFILPVIFCLFVFIICKRTGYLMRWRCNFIDYSFVWWNLDWTIIVLILRFSIMLLWYPHCLNIAKQWKYISLKFCLLTITIKWLIFLSVAFGHLYLLCSIYLDNCIARSTFE